MKHQYFGDINDYRKYGLLRCIADATGQPLGILWLLTEDDGRADGEFRRYLHEPKRWRQHDSDLYDGLRRLLELGQTRHVGHAANWGLLPRAKFFEEVVTDSAVDRLKLLAAAGDELADCPIIFIDPDNGLEVKSVPYGSKGSRKYVFWKELEGLYSKGHSLVVYQHFPRVARDQFKRDLVDQVHARMNGAGVFICSTAHVAFLLIMQPQHVPSMEEVVRSIELRWKGQLDMTCFPTPNIDPSDAPAALRSV